MACPHPRALARKEHPGYLTDRDMNPDQPWIVVLGYINQEHGSPIIRQTDSECGARAIAAAINAALDLAHTTGANQ